MKPTRGLLVFLIATFIGQIDFAHLPSFKVAYADPPPWAPANGYRRKHHDHGDDDDQGDEEHHHRHHGEDRDDDHRRWEQRVHEVVINRFEEAFRRLDANHDGRISRIEWLEGDSLFDKLDRNHDGILTRDEYEHVDEQRGIVGTLIYTIKSKLASLWDKLW